MIHLLSDKHSVAIKNKLNIICKHYHKKIVYPDK